MHGTKWFSTKHKAWAVVTDDAISRHGYYTIEFPDLGIFRRYNEDRIRRECLGLERNAQLGVKRDDSSMLTNSMIAVSQAVTKSPRVSAPSQVYTAPSTTPSAQATPSSASNAVLDYSPWKVTKRMGTLINLVFAWKD